MALFSKILNVFDLCYNYSINKMESIMSHTQSSSLNKNNSSCIAIRRGNIVELQLSYTNNNRDNVVIDISQLELIRSVVLFDTIAYALQLAGLVNKKLLDFDVACEMLANCIKGKENKELGTIHA